MASVKDWVLWVAGFVKVDGVWIPRCLAHKLVEALAKCAMPEAHRKYLEIIRALNDRPWNKS
jgi:hypothetical protein